MHRHINGYGRLFGGQLLMWIDELAGIVATRHLECRITTASIDRIWNFKQRLSWNDTVVLIGKITHVGRSSMEVRVDTYVETLDGMRHVINQLMVMVAIDEEGKAVSFPASSVVTRARKPNGRQERNGTSCGNRDG
ncbi:MAG: acyl-CoA thioesterase [Lachnospiraceae bacterium]